MHLNVHFEYLVISLGRFPSGGTVGLKATPSALPVSSLPEVYCSKPIISVTIILCWLVQDM